MRFVGDPLPDELRDLIVAEARRDGLGYVFVAAADANTYEIRGYRDEHDPEERLWIRAHRMPSNLTGSQKYAS